MILVVTGAFGTISKGLEKELEDLEIGGQVETIQTATLICRNTENNPEDLRRLAVTQYPVRNH